MKKAITLILIAASLYILNRILHVTQAVILFITVGVIPGTNTSLSPDSMLLIMGVTALSAIAGFVFSQTYQYLIMHYYVNRFVRHSMARFSTTMQHLDHWYRSVQSLPAKVATPEE